MADIPERKEVVHRLTDATSRYQVVCIRRDGSRNVRSQKLTRATAEVVRDALRSMQRYKRVVIEPQLPGTPKSKS
jgi:hypothetical protein